MAPKSTLGKQKTPLLDLYWTCVGVAPARQWNDTRHWELLASRSVTFLATANNSSVNKPSIVADRERRTTG